MTCNRQLSAGRQQGLRWLMAAIVLGGQLVLEPACWTAETKLDPQAAKRITDQYMAAVGRLHELLDGVRVEAHLSVEKLSQANPSQNSRREGHLRYYVSGRKIKVTETPQPSVPDPKPKSVYIDDGVTSYTASLNPSGKYFLQQRKAQNDRTQVVQKYDLYKIVHCPIALSTFYIPDLISSADFDFRITDVDEITGSETGPVYKLSFTFEFRPGKVVYTGWLVADPKRYWAVTEYELTSESRGPRKTISGTVTYDSPVDQPPHPSSISSSSVSKITIPKATETLTAGTYAVETRETIRFDSYEFSASPDAEFSLASIDLAAAELPPGANMNRTSYILGFCSVAAMLGSLGIAFYLRRTGGKPRLAGGV
jgi:hypothetical protein